MRETITTEEIQELVQDGTDVVCTVYEFGPTSIKLSTKADLSIITVSGPYSRAVGKEIERIAKRCRSNIGLGFRSRSGRDGPVEPLRFDASVGTLLRNLNAHCRRRGTLFLLCTPPQELRDSLKLMGVLDEYQVVDADRFVSGLPARSEPEPKEPQRARRAQAGPTHHVERRIFKLHESLKRTAKLERGLDSAARCVAKLLPQTPPRISGYDFAFCYMSSEKVGGDFFDFIDLGDESLGIIIGDVSGHGIDAALVMGITKKLIGLRARDFPRASPAAVLRRVHRDFRGDFDRRTFVTVIYAKLYPAEERIVFARAGHEYPIYFVPDGHPEILASGGAAVGIGSDQVFGDQIENVEIELPPGAGIVLYSDGLSECRSERAGLYTRDRIVFDLRQTYGNDSSRNVLDRILGSVRAFAGNTPQADDLTAIILRRRGLEEGEGPLDNPDDINNEDT